MLARPIYKGAYVRLRSRPGPIGFIAPRPPSKVPSPPAGDGWIHEIKYDGLRLLAWRQGERVRLFTRRGLDWTGKFPEVARAAPTSMALTRRCRSRPQHQERT